MVQQVTRSSEQAGPFRVLHCLRAPVGGLFRHVCDLARAQSGIGYDVGVLCADEPGDPETLERLNQLKEHCSLGVKRISLARLPGPGDVRALSAAAAICRSIEPDIVHGHGAKGGLLARFIGPVGGRIYTPHGGTIHYSPLSPAGLLFGAAERFMLGRSDGLIFESGFARQSFASRFGRLPENASVVHNGLAPEEFEAVPLGDAPADLLFLGELRALKGVYTLLEAVADISERLPVTLAIVGDGPEMDALRKRVMADGLESRVRFFGALPAREAFALGRIVVMPSHRDSFPYVALEAAAAGKPLIATDTGGIPEIFGPLSDGLVPPGNAEALASRLSAWLQNSAPFEKEAAQLRERVRERFSLTEMAAGVSKVYRRALDLKGGTAVPRSSVLASHPKVDLAE